MVPFTRLVHFLVAPFHYIERPYQRVIWNWDRRRVRSAEDPVDADQAQEQLRQFFRATPGDHTHRSRGAPAIEQDVMGPGPEELESRGSRTVGIATGKKIATRNLWLSIPCLLCGFAVWLYWGIITVQMLNLGFPFSKEDLFTLMAIAGLSGATLRIPSTFFIRLAGGRNTIFLTTSLLILPSGRNGSDAVEPRDRRSGSSSSSRC